jgi:hypothetical protein
MSSDGVDRSPVPPVPSKGLPGSIADSVENSAEAPDEIDDPEPS